MVKDNGHEPNSDAALERRLKRLGLTDQENEWTDRYLTCGHVEDRNWRVLGSGLRPWPGSFATCFRTAG
jgi:hypothetical protein